MCTKNELHIILKLMAKAYRDIYGKKLVTVLLIWDISADLEVEYGTIVSPTVIPYEEFEKYKNDLPYYRNILKEGVKVVA